MRNVLPLLAMLAFVGCRSNEILQSNVFSDERGNVLRVSYGRSDSEHVNYFIAPSNGRELEFKSKLFVDVCLPDGDDFRAWQCMNLRSRGTTYKTDDEEFVLEVTGFSAMVYSRDEKINGYRRIYYGILCESPKTDYEPDERWRTLKPNGKGGWQYK